MSKFTPGKWYVGEFGGIFSDQPPEHDGGNPRRANVFLTQWTAEDRANARLVAAAPEMYELLQTLVQREYDNTTTAILLLEVAKLLKRIDVEEARA